MPSSQLAKLALLALVAAASDNESCAGARPGTCRLVCVDDPPEYCVPPGSTSRMSRDAKAERLALSKQACCARGGGKTIAVWSGPPVEKPVDHARWAAKWVPAECARHVVTEFQSIDDLVRLWKPGDDKRKHLGEAGGQWNACTHLSVYGTNFAVYFARALAFRLRPRSVLEFGCGLGTTSDFLARFTPGGSRVICIEPEPMLAEIFAKNAPPRRPMQLAFNAFAPENEACVRDLTAQPRFDLVLSLEVAEHLESHQLPPLIDALCGATRKYLVFTAARPPSPSEPRGQAGTGHVPGSMKNKMWWRQEFEKRGLIFLPNLTRRLGKAADPERPYDLGRNMVVMGRAPLGVDRDDVSLFDGLDCDLFPSKFNGCEYPMIKSPGAHPLLNNREEGRAYREAVGRGQLQALWPEISLLEYGLRRHGPQRLSCK